MATTRRRNTDFAEAFAQGFAHGLAEQQVAKHAAKRTAKQAAKQQVVEITGPDLEEACSAFVAALVRVRSAWRCAVLLVKLFRTLGSESDELHSAKEVLGDILLNMQLLPFGLVYAKSIASSIESISGCPAKLSRISHEVVELCVKLNLSIEDANEFLDLACRADNELSLARVLFQTAHVMHDCFAKPSTSVD